MRGLLNIPPSNERPGNRCQWKAHTQFPLTILGKFIYIAQTQGNTKGFSVRYDHFFYKVLFDLNTKQRQQEKSSAWI